MVDTEEGEGNSNRRNEWEVVSLTASASAATPNPDDTEEVSDRNDVDGNVVSNQVEAETSLALFMSGHFVFPPSHHENLPLEPEENGIPEDSEEHRGKDDDDVEFDIEGGRSSGKAEKDRTLGGVVHDDEFPGNPLFDEEGREFEELNPDENKQSPSSATFSSSDEAGVGALESEDNSHLPAGFSKPIEDDDTYEPELPCEAWWKRRAASLYIHAKDANAFWSICVAAAAVMGLVVLGQRWQQERWQVLQSKWQLSMKNENMVRILGPIYRIKDVIVGGHRSGSFIRGGGSSSDN